MKKSIEIAKAAKPETEVGIFHEDFGNPETIKAFLRAGINAIICKPQVVPIVRLCAAKEILGQKTLPH
jgi:hypothetical protein